MTKLGIGKKEIRNQDQVINNLAQISHIKDVLHPYIFTNNTKWTSELYDGRQIKIPVIDLDNSWLSDHALVYSDIVIPVEKKGGSRKKRNNRKVSKRKINKRKKRNLSRKKRINRRKKTKNKRM